MFYLIIMIIKKLAFKFIKNKYWQIQLITSCYFNLNVSTFFMYKNIAWNIENVHHSIIFIKL